MGPPTFFRYTVGPLVLMTTVPLIVILLNLIIEKYHGSPLLFVYDIPRYGGIINFLAHCLMNNWPQVKHLVWILSFYMLQILLYHVIPGKIVAGRATSTGFIPKYKQNGIPCYAINLAIVLVCYAFDIIPFQDIFLHLTSLAIVVCILAWMVTIFLYLSATFWPRNPMDVIRSGYLITDIYTGIHILC